ncbi:MAG: hypothetical protein A2W89_15120 [Bacteroidetes bacterium GWE2_42_39]|nr:MAG: hypothetical protein A2W89_15120 [Bacteroidetes bacterium GWE2_42_39]
MKEAWMRHPVFGDPSFDNFKRFGKNPLHRGSSPYEWPVNGFYFEDPVTGNEYIYVSQYRKGYQHNPDTTISTEIDKTIIVFCSYDKGKTWNELGPVFKNEKVMFDGEQEQVKSALDASVVYHEGKYYMIVGARTTSHKNWRDHSGIALAVSDSPQGPYKLKRYVLPSSYFNNNPLFGKYNRCYAGMLLKTKDKWVILFMMDSENYYSWALGAVSAPTLEGPWSTPLIIRSCENEFYYPSLMEFYPAFQYQDTIYAPATSVAANRNFQCIFRISADQVMNSESWELWKEGSIWHSLNTENEYAGIWGQTITGFVDKEGRFKVMFTSKDKENQGTINVASVPWDKFYTDAGFVLTGHESPSCTFIPEFYQWPEINTSFSYYGTIAFLMNYQAPLGPNKPYSKATLNQLMFTSHNRVQLNENQWLLLHASANGITDTIARGIFDKKDWTSLRVEHHGKATNILIDEKNVWQGEFKDNAFGRFGIMTKEHSGIEVESCIVDGEKQPGFNTWLYTEGLLNSGSGMVDWKELNDTVFMYGIGAVSKIDTACAKWSFKGSGFELYSPKMPGLGKIQIILNGETIANVDLHSEISRKSKVICSMKSLPKRENSLRVKGKNGQIVVDCLRVYD